MPTRFIFSISNLQKGQLSNNMTKGGLILLMSLYDYVSEEYDFLTEEKIDTAKRNRMKTTTFGLPDKRKYPLNDKQHVLSAITYFNKCDPSDEKELASNIIAAIKKFNMDVNVGESNRFKKYYKK
jgi:hypothetical protein